MEKEGYVLKKSSKKFLGIAKWQKRYAVLEGRHLTFYVDQSKKVPKKQVDMKKVETVCFHYDESAPIKSKKLEKGNKDESRFDVDTPNRVYLLKVEGNGMWESEAWVRTLKKSAEFHNPNYKDN